MAPSRSATASIRGYLYQTLLAARAWFDLADGETLIVEGDEDFDRVLVGELTSVQVKARDRTATLRGTAKALEAFAHAYAARGDRTLRFVYVSTERLTRRPDDSLTRWLAGDLDGAAEALAALADEQAWNVAWPGSADWRGFVDAVTFELERPRLAAVRVELADRLANDPRTADLVGVGALVERLLDDLLTASATDDRSLRRRTRADLDALIASAREALATWARGPRATALVGWLDSTERLAEVLHDGTLPIDNPERPSQLLDARYEVLPFFEVQRRDELDDFSTWCDDSQRVAARVLRPRTARRAARRVGRRPRSSDRRRLDRRNS